MSKLTPNSELSLCFPAELLPESIPLPSDYVLRPLSSTDYRRGHLKVLSVLTLAPDVGETAWKERFDLMIEAHETYYCVVVVNKTNDQIVGTGTISMEKKFIRHLGLVGHIEDIAVDKSVQGKGFGKLIVEVLTALSESLGAYKAILDCDLTNEGFYVKCGYANKGAAMAKYVLKP